MPHPGASAPLSRNPQLKLFKPLKVKVATGVVLTVQVPPDNVDSYMFVPGKDEKSSKKICGVPWLSTTMSENWVWENDPLTRAGGVNGRPAPAELDTRIADEKAGTVAEPSVHGSVPEVPAPLQKSV